MHEKRTSREFSTWPALTWQQLFLFFFWWGEGGYPKCVFSFVSLPTSYSGELLWCSASCTLSFYLLSFFSFPLLSSFFHLTFFLNLLLTFVQCFHVCVRVCVYTCFFISIIVPFFCSLPFSRLTFNQQTYILCVCPRCLLKSCFVLKQAIYTLVVFVC